MPARATTNPPNAQSQVLRIAAVVPCFNRQADLDLILADLRAAHLSGAAVSIELRVIIVDNCSEPPLQADSGVIATHADHNAEHSAGSLSIQVLRLPSNRGGSGGFNAGIGRALSDPDVDFVWLVDSDARVDPSTLINLAERLRRRPDLVALGCALADPITRAVHEIGGMVCRRTGRLLPARTSVDLAHDDHELVACDYAASCCLLVRAAGIRLTGLMPEVFLNGDDTEWCIRLSEVTGLNIAADPTVIAYHPRFDRFPTWARYYHSRNAFGAIAALGLGRRVRFIRAMVATLRAMNQALMGRKDLARLHIRGLADAAFKGAIGPAPDRASRFDRFRPLDQLPAALGPAEIGAPRGLFVHPDLELTPPQKQALATALQVPLNEFDVPPATGRRGTLRGFLRRALLGPRFGIAVLPSTGGPDAWVAGATQIQLVPEGFVVRRLSRWSALRAALRTLARGLWYGTIIAIQRGRPSKLPPAPPPSASAPAAVATESAANALASSRPRASSSVPAPSLSIIVLSFNRRAALDRTLAALTTDRFTRSAEIIVVDNASTDSSPEMVRDRYPSVRLITLARNLGVAAFNRGVEAASGAYVLVLDDDAAPEPESLDIALELLARRPDLSAVALLPRHPDTGAPEWPSAADMPRQRDRWPMMGCGNLVRRINWLKVGGYDSRFFLYRNDTDLALKLLGSGMGVHFNPAWVVWHDSPAAARKSERWLHLATRNWFWMTRRHAGSPWRRFTGMCFGGVWAARLAGSERARLKAVWRGIVDGIIQPAGRLPRTVRPTGADFAALLKLQMLSRAASRPPPPETALGVPTPPVSAGASETEARGALVSASAMSSSSSPRHSA